MVQTTDVRFYLKHGKYLLGIMAVSGLMNKQFVQVC